MRRFAFLSGLILGGSVCAWILGSALTFLLTGKLPAVRASDGGPPRLELIDVNALYESPEIVSRTASRWGEEG